jgi:DNA-binding response OmpR family regulator
VTKRRILIVDDDPRLQDIVGLYLDMEGYEIDKASNGEDGLKQIDANAPDLIIMDIMMPGMDGIEACRRIRSNPATAQIPVLMFSALSGDEDVERARLAGANHLITKPFTLAGLSGVVKSFIPD